MRINARLDADSGRQLQYLMETTGLSVSDLVKASLAHYYEAVRSERPPRLARLLAVAGSQGSGRGDLSVRSKQSLDESLAVKHRVQSGGPREPETPKFG